MNKQEKKRGQEEHCVSLALTRAGMRGLGSELDERTRK